MAQHNELGQQGEQKAIAFLKEKAYQILETNWRYGHTEIDIIAREGPGLIVFVEVKTRSNANFGYPEEAVDMEKRKHLLKAANHYLETHELEDELRFDIIAITLSNPANEDVYHIKDAITPIS